MAKLQKIGVTQALANVTKTNGLLLRKIFNGISLREIITSHHQFVKLLLYPANCFSLPQITQWQFEKNL